MYHWSILKIKFISAYLLIPEGNHRLSMQRESANSHMMGIILMTILAIILAAIVATMLFNLLSFQYSVTPIPAIFVITNVIHIDDYTGKLNYDSRVIILHTGTANYQNKNLKAQFYKNGVQVNANIQTLNGDDFIKSTVHTGVQWIGYEGCKGATWAPGEMSAIDLKDGTFHPGDTAQIDIIDKSTNQVISRHSYRVK
jgi:hypothetical protein